MFSGKIPSWKSFPIFSTCQLNIREKRQRYTFNLNNSLGKWITIQFIIWNNPYSEQSKLNVSKIHVSGICFFLQTISIYQLPINFHLLNHIRLISLFQIWHMLECMHDCINSLRFCNTCTASVIDSEEIQLISIYSK